MLSYLKPLEYNAIFYKRNWKDENFQIQNMLREGKFFCYDKVAFDIYIRFLGHYFFKYLKIEFLLTNKMKIKANLWVGPVIITPFDTVYPLVELKSVKKRVKDWRTFCKKCYSWKSLKKKKEISSIQIDVFMTNNPRIYGIWYNKLKSTF